MYLLANSGQGPEVCFPVSLLSINKSISAPTIMVGRTNLFTCDGQDAVQSGRPPGAGLYQPVHVLNECAQLRMNELFMEEVESGLTMTLISSSFDNRTRCLRPPALTRAR